MRWQIKQFTDSQNAINPIIECGQLFGGEE